MLAGVDVLVVREVRERGATPLLRFVVEVGPKGGQPLGTIIFL